MPIKPEFVDLVGEATHQSWRRPVARASAAKTAEAGVSGKPRSRLSHWPPVRLQDWRLDLLKPWKKRNNPRG